jgi:hypothetical protein
MQIDLSHFHHWMRAVRQSSDPMRTMDAFWAGQMKSKSWLINELRRQREHYTSWPRIDIHGGWNGVLASMLFQSDLYISTITNIDIDPTCEPLANTMNQIEYEAGKFKAVTADMCEYVSDAEIIINTSCEHITQDQYDAWLELQPRALFILQSNNYQIDEHIRIADSLEKFKEQSNLDVIWAGSLETQLYTRWMIIGKKHD